MTYPMGNKAFRNIVFAVILILGLGLSILAFALSYSSEKRLMELEFNEAVDNRYSAFKRELDSDLSVLVSLQALYYTSERNVVRSEFRNFTSHILEQHASIKALEWIPLVPDSQRNAYEQSARRNGFPDFHFTELVRQGEMKTEEKRKEYFPVYFVEPYKGNEKAFGFDLASNPTRLEALEVARKIGETRATARITLVQETKSQFGVIVFTPIYRDDATVNADKALLANLKGFVLGVFRIGDIAEKATGYLKPEGIDFFVYDSSAPENEQFLYTHSSRTRKNYLLTQTHPQTDLTTTKTLDVAGRKWTIIYSATPGFIATRNSWRPWGLLVVGLVFTGLVTRLLIILSRSENIEKFAKELSDVNANLSNEIVERKKAEAVIEASEQKIKALFNTVNDAILIVDPEGHILDVNNITCERLGYRRDELVKMTPHNFVTPEYATKVSERIAESSQGGSSIFETAWVTHDGRIIPTEISSRTIEYDGKTAFLGVARDITERKKAEQQLKQAIKEKETLLKEIHHRVKNNMAVVSSLLSLQANKIEDTTVRSLFEESQQRVKSMALVHERLYQAKDLSSINFADYAKSIVSEIISLYLIDTSLITTEIDIEGIELDLESAVPCGLIINELLTNAFKYAFPNNRSGIVSVHFKKNKGIYILTIKDNGVGLPEGFDYKSASTLGIRLVGVLTRQLLGTLEIKSDKGTEAIVAFHAERS